jgi:hypothetical protein
MTGEDVPRYRSTYREAEASLVHGAASRGQSVCFVGVSGIGKTNLIHFLRYDDAFQPSETKGAPLRLIFPHVDARLWKLTPASLWELMLDALARCNDMPAPPRRVDPAMTAEAKTRQALSICAQQVCRDPTTRVMFLLDDFDDVLRKGPLDMLEALNTLRGECRDRLSYLVFSKRLPHVLGRRFNLEANSKFYQLFRQRIYALAPLNTADALQMLERLNARSTGRLSHADLGQILQLAGGHCGLLRAVYECRLEVGPLGNGPASALLRQTGVRETCKQLFRSLHPAEQTATIRLAEGSRTQEDLDFLDHLRVRGLLVSSNPVAWFSPVWELYLRQCASEDLQL